MPVQGSEDVISCPQQPGVHWDNSKYYYYLGRAGLVGMQLSCPGLRTFTFCFLTHGRSGVESESEQEGLPALDQPEPS